MPYFIRTRNQIFGPFSEQQLLEMQSKGKLTRATEISEDKRNWQAVQAFPFLCEAVPVEEVDEVAAKENDSQVATPSSSIQPTPIPSSASVPKEFVCTNCGNYIFEHEDVCTSCGTKPTGRKKNCRHCAATLNPTQVVCTACGTAINASSAPAQTARTASQMMGQISRKIKVAPDQESLISWLFDFEFQDIRIHRFCRLAYKSAFIRTIGFLILGTIGILIAGFIMIYAQPEPQSRVIFTVVWLFGIVFFWYCIYLYLLRLRMNYEERIIKLDCMIETTKAAQLYAENSIKEQDEI